VPARSFTGYRVAEFESVVSEALPLRTTQSQVKPSGEGCSAAKCGRRMTGTVRPGSGTTARWQMPAVSPDKDPVASQG
jgi:hypothetical protein